MGLFTVLAVCMCIGIASGQEEYFKKYGESERLRIFSVAEYLYFEPRDSDIKSVLWTRRRPSNRPRGALKGYFYLIEGLTPADSGIYTVKTKSNLTVSTYSIHVFTMEKTFNLTVGDSLHFELPMDQTRFTVSFTSNDFARDLLFSRGRVTSVFFDDRLEMYSSNYLTVNILNVQVADSGVFEVRDRQNNLAMQVNLDVTEPPTSVGVKAGMSAAIVSLLVSCCCCLKRCCCKKSSKSAAGDSPEAESPADPQQDVAQPSPPSYFAEPRRLGNPVDAYAYRPAAPPTFERCNPAPVAPSPVPYPSAPSAQAPAAAGPSAAEQGPSASNFLSSENEPRFEMKDMMGPPPLYSECVSADVYTSDKLNFSFL